MARHSQFGIGGPAQWYRAVESLSELSELLARCHATGVPVTVFGAGSNALILDGGIPGLVVTLAERRMRVLDESTVELSGGYMMPRAALDCARKGIGGLEFGIGVPGTCGASVCGNAGAFGKEMGDVLIDCDAVTPNGTSQTLRGDECGFAYRHSRFKAALSGHIVTTARLHVAQDDIDRVRARTAAIQAQRKQTQPIGVRSLGSVFTNPPGDYAGRLIEAAGLKGRRHGGAQISPKHANFILNLASATAADVLTLVNLAHDTVLECFGVDLVKEIVVLGVPG